MARSFSCCLLVFVMIALISDIAHAQPVSAKAKLDVARAYVDAGLAAQNSGDYDSAITFYKKAYDLEPHPVLLFDMAQAHRLAGRIDQAFTLYQKYLEADSGGSMADVAREQLAKIEAGRADQAREAEAARRAEVAREAEAARKTEDARRAEDARKVDEAHDAGVGTGRTQRWLGLGTVGFGICAIGVSVGFGVHAKNLSDELSKPGWVYDAGKVKSGETAQTISIVSAVVGGTAVVGGALLYWLGRSHPMKEQVTVVPWLSSGAVGVAFGRTL